MELIDKKCLEDNNLTVEQLRDNLKLDILDPNLNKCAILCEYVAYGFLDENRNLPCYVKNMRDRLSCNVNETIEDKCEKAYQLKLCLLTSTERSPKSNMTNV